MLGARPGGSRQTGAPQAAADRAERKPEMAAQFPQSGRYSAGVSADEVDLGGGPRIGHLRVVSGGDPGWERTRTAGAHEPGHAAQSRGSAVVGLSVGSRRRRDADPA